MRARARRWRWAVAVLGFGLLMPPVRVCGSQRPPATRTGPRTNLLLVTVDTLRADHVAAYGGDPRATPTLAALAGRCTRFDPAIAPAPLTLPSHASLLTGRLPPHHGVRHNGLYRLPPQAETLAERLRAAGYETAAIVGSQVLARRYGLDQGFALYDDGAARGAAAGGYAERTADRVRALAIRWLRQAREPFFLWVHFYDPHAAYRPPPPFRERFAGDPYTGEIAFVDHELGRILEALRAQGRSERTLIVVTADHGESLGEHREPTHGYTLYDATLAVPLLFCGPGVPRGVRIAGPVALVDVAPTVVEQLGLAPWRDADGHSLAPLWRGEEPPGRRTAYAETLATRLDHGWSPLYALRTAARLFVLAPRPELYDVLHDPCERHNLLLSRQPSAQREAKALRARLDALRAAPVTAVGLALDRATLERLRALGYAIAPVAPPERPIDPKDGLRWLGRYREALEAYETGRLERARAELVELLAEDPASAEAQALLARVELRLGHASEALEHALRAAEAVPRSAVYRNLVGDARAATGDRARARAAYRAAAELDPTEPSPELGLMALAARAGRIDEAQAHARRARALQPEALWVIERIGAIWEATGHPQLALAAYREMLERRPGLPAIRRRVARLEARAGARAPASPPPSPLPGPRVGGGAR